MTKEPRGRGIHPDGGGPTEEWPRPATDTWGDPVPASAPAEGVIRRMESLLERRNLTFAECSLAEEWEAVMRDALSALSASSAPPAGVFSEAVAFQQSLRPKNAESKRLVEERETFERCVEIAEKRAADHRDASLDVAFYSTDRMLRRAKANEAEHIAAAIRALKPGRDAT